MKMKTNSWIQIGLFAAFLPLITLAPPPAHGQALPAHEFTPDGHAYMRGEVIVQFNNTVTDAQIERAFRQAGLSMIRHLRTPAMQDEAQLGLTHTTTSLPVPAAIRVLNKLPGIDFAEPNWAATPDYMSNDPLYLDGSLWGIYGDDLPSPIGPPSTWNAFGSQAEKAWAAGFIGSPGVFIGVIDSGFQPDHPDLAANVWVNPGEIPGNGIDDDGNGYIDDVHGWNSMHDNGVTYDLNDRLNEIHGTAVAGIIGAEGGNGIGVAGVNWSVQLVAGKFLPRGAYLDAIEAVDYMTALKTRKGLNIVALNNSWSGASFSQALLEAYVRAANAGILSICSASNQASDNDAKPRYPAGFDTTAGAGYNAIIAVAATDKEGNLASISNYGRNSVALGAPGADITTTTIDSSYITGRNGTSYAAPHVSGAVALYASAYPGAGALEIRENLLTGGVRPLAALAGITITGGILDVAELLSVPGSFLSAPASPANVRASVEPTGYLNLSWVDQSSDELGFAIERSTDGQNFNLLDTLGANYQSYTDRAVTLSTTYHYRVRAYNPGGSSAHVNANSSVTISNIQAPAAPSSLKAAALTRGAGIKLDWLDRSNNEIGFHLERRVVPSGKNATPGPWQLLATLGANTTSHEDATAISSTSYTYRIRAFNLAGASSYSNEVTVTAK
jgi:subtilisin family serine protease